MKLVMRNSDQAAQTLPANESVIETGSMGDCVSVIVMWGYELGTYKNMRGFHGSGGIRAVNWGSLFNGMADERATAIYILAGPGNSQNDWSLEDAMSDARAAAPRKAQFFIWHGITSAAINRQGQAEYCEGNPERMPVFGGRHQFKTSPTRGRRQCVDEPSYRSPRQELGCAFRPTHGGLLWPGPHWHWEG
jgi:hypothetical protein